MKGHTKLWIGLGILILLSPLGLILPAKFGAGTAWGEWSTEEMHKLIGYVPAGLAKGSDRWKAPMPDYATKGKQEPSLKKQSSEYILSAVLGVSVVAGVAVLLGKALAKRENSTPS